MIFNTAQAVHRLGRQEAIGSTVALTDTAEHHDDKLVLFRVVS
jgi:hypothetical protein